MEVQMSSTLALPRLAPPIWRRRSWQASSGLAAALLVALAACAFAVWAMGGTRLMYTNLMYLPIVLGGFAFGPVGGGLAALIGGLALGPWMPIDVAAGLYQAPENWLGRTACFLAVGLLTGGAAARLHRQIEFNRMQNRRDPLTDLPNRRALLETVEADIRADGHPFVMMVLDVIDLPRFDEILTTLGHARADRLAVSLARLIEGELPAESRLYYLGALRFAVQMPDLGADRARAIYVKLRTRLDGARRYAVPPIYTELAIGVARHPGDADNAIDLLRAAVNALCDAEQGAAGLAFYDAEHGAGREDAYRLLVDLAGAVDAGDRFEVVFQPQFDLAAGRLRGGEALLRWNEPGRGQVPPARFIPLAERTMLMGQITHYVLERALEALAAHQPREPEIVISVNVSLRNLEDPEFPGHLADTLRRHGVRPEGLEVEVTETALMTDSARVLEALHRIKRLGVRIALDDFGTGYSSLASLQSLPIDVIKLDRSFIQPLTHDAKADRIVRLAVELGHSLDREVIAEGVETAEQLRRLKDFACGAVQGYLISRPLDRAAFDGFVAGWRSRMPDVMPAE